VEHAQAATFTKNASCKSNNLTWGKEIELALKYMTTKLLGGFQPLHRLEGQSKKLIYQSLRKILTNIEILSRTFID